MTHVPASSRAAAFIGGTITQPLVIAPGDPNAVPLTIQAGWNAQNTDFFAIVNTDTGTKMVNVDLSANLLVNDHATEAQGVNLGGNGGLVAVGAANLSGGAFASSNVAATKKIGALGHAQVAQQATPVTLGDVIAVLQSFGLCA